MRLVYRESLNERNMHNLFKNNCESLWGPALDEANLAAATVRLYGDYCELRGI